jgi:glycogen debranching enzyme
VVGREQKVSENAHQVLKKNRQPGGYTVPAEGLYPYQWCWDSGPIALGWAAAGDWEQAWTELERLLSAQWESGMVPHIVFWEVSDDYFPGPETWGTNRTPPTTGITQPPLPVTAAVRLYQQDADRDRAVRRFAGLWPRLVAWLDWLERARRGPHGGLVVVHPWESGMDNAPTWDEPLARVEAIPELPLARRDLESVAASQRPSNEEYRRYMAIVESLRDRGWATERQRDDGPFAVEDVAFTAIAARAASDLAAVAPELGRDATALDTTASRLRAGVAALWDEPMDWFRPYDVRGDAFVGPATATGVLALWANAATPDQANRIAVRLGEWNEALEFGVPTCDPNDAAFEPARYWRGPVWVIVNWLVAEGLAQYGFDGHAAEIREQTTTLVAAAGDSEYYDPRTGEGIGGRGFSWSAALTLAWLLA